ncbi:MAG TPA: T9SS type A sorting domain-containing protein [Flavobacterium sp.]|jgi:hypothetical protein|nr:T9SS type A sorting domain-containing protein [Flavobacterium sp.]HQV36726.1 T9SS type A sorting domain-containing protein [Flavobacterium sp.]HQX03006.1 T9SS type A sorting domain-containing protein [Flavobacterium sp.]HRZ31744.1 T9SS type A sorting domain-containing protein [Flavobacterium sp.]HRZ73957.1 T9SS type A sorting domain-containing protein [Flavobacterium sp.]
MKKITLLFLLLFGFIGISQTISHSTSMTLSNTNVACNGGTPSTSSDNRYFRYFKLSDFSITADYTISSVQFGVQTLTIPTLPDGFPVTVKIYATTSNNFPVAYPAGYTELAQVTTNFLLADVETLVSVPIAATIPAGSNVLVEVGYLAQTASSGNRIFLSANDLGESAPTYISSTACALVPPTPLASINFPNAHLVLSVTGTTLGVKESILQKVSVFPNPSKGKFTVDLPASVSIEKSTLTDITGKQMAINLDASNSFSISEYNTGIYILNLQTSEGVLNKRLIKE